MSLLFVLDVLNIFVRTVLIAGSILSNKLYLCLFYLFKNDLSNRLALAMLSKMFFSSLLLLTSLELSNINLSLSF